MSFFFFIACGRLSPQIRRLQPSPGMRTEGSLEAMPPCNSLLDGTMTLVVFFSCYQPCTVNVCCHTGDNFNWKVEDIHLKCLEKWKKMKKRKRKNEPYNSKELNHPANILGFHLGGSSAVVFCATDSQSVYGTLLSLDLCMFFSTNLLCNWQMQGVKYWLGGVCLSAQMRMNLSVFCVLFFSFFFWLPSWFHLSVLPGRHKPLPSALDSKFLCIHNRQ